jgi:hypothetical protein
MIASGRPRPKEGVGLRHATLERVQSVEIGRGERHALAHGVLEDRQPA